MSQWVTAAEAAGLPGLPRSISQINRRALSLEWPRRQRPGDDGRPAFEYPVEVLPAQARMHLAARAVQPAATTTPGTSIPAAFVLRAGRGGEQADAKRAHQSRINGTAAVANITGKRADERDARLHVLVLLQRFWSGMGGPLCPAVEAFCAAWNNGEVHAGADLRARFPRFTRWQTVRDWHLQVDRHGGAGVTRKPPKNTARFAVLEGPLGDRVLALLYAYPHTNPVAIRRQLELEDRDKPAAEKLVLPDVRSFQRGIAFWKAQNRQAFAHVTNPDQWRSHYLSAAGSRSERATGVNALWEIDGTSGEVMLADGRRWNITALIDVYTRRLKVRVSASPRAAVVMDLLRSTILEWGAPEVLKTDNGSDYTAQTLELALHQLKVNHELCLPFQPQQKPHIERAIGTLVHQLFELLPGYLGHNVAQRSDIEARKSFAERLMKSGGDALPVELALQPDELQALIDNWCDRYHDTVHGGLNGRTPNEVLAAWVGTVATIDERALDIFLAATNAGGMRTIGKKGIKLDNGWFNCAELGGLEGQQVLVKQTESDLGTCYVFDLHGLYIGTALDHGRLGISAREVAAERAAVQRRRLQEQKAAWKEQARAIDPKQLVANVLRRKADAAIDQAPNVTRLRPTAAHASPAIESVASAADGGPQISAAAAATLKRMDEEGERPRAATVFNLHAAKPVERYSHALRLRARITAGEQVDLRDTKWLDGYVTTPEFKAHDRVHEGQDPLAVEGGGGG